MMNPSITTMLNWERQLEAQRQSHFRRHLDLDVNLPWDNLPNLHHQPPHLRQPQPPSPQPLAQVSGKRDVDPPSVHECLEAVCYT